MFSLLPIWILLSWKFCTDLYYKISVWWGCFPLWIQTSMVGRNTLTMNLDVWPSHYRCVAGGIFREDQKDSSVELAFKYAVLRLNRDRTLLPNTTLVYDIQYVPKDDSFRTSKRGKATILLEWFLYNTSARSQFSSKSSSSSYQINDVSIPLFQVLLLFQVTINKI